MKRACFLLLLCAGWFSMPQASAQDCGTPDPTEEQIDFMRQIHSRNYGHTHESPVRDNALVRIPLKIHIIRRSDGTGGITVSQVEAEIARANTFYQNANIQFFMSGDPNYIDNTDFYDFNQSQQGAVSATRNVPGMINVYFANSLTSSSGGGLCGYTYLPPSDDHLFMSNGCTGGNNSTFEHELGHYFSLYHTHGKTNNGTTDELVNGSNCTSAGDDICDTPADPNLSGRVTGNCGYDGSGGVDANGDAFQPNPANIMAYSLDQCQNMFTNGQYERIRRGFENGRSYLNFLVEGFEATFVASERSICKGEQVVYSSPTPSVQGYFWEFEGGDPATSTRAEPRVTYAEPGRYTVRLTVEGAAGEDELERVNYVLVTDPLEGATSDTTMTTFAEETLPTNWELENTDRARSFELLQLASDSDPTTYSAAMLNFVYDPISLPQTDILATQRSTYENAKAFIINFRYAYAYRQNGLAVAADTLRLGYRSDCDESWVTFWEKGGADLATVAPTSDYFEPTSAADWSTASVTFPIEPDEVGASLRFGFINFTAELGNNLYIDDVEIVPDYSLETPTNFRSLGVENGALRLRWFDNSTNESRYVVERSVDGGEFVRYAELPINSVAYEDDAPIAGSTLTYRIFAETNQGTKSANSDEVTVSFVTALEFEAVRNLSVYPNPANGVSHVRLENDYAGTLGLSLRDLSGRLIWSASKEKTGRVLDAELPTERLPAGMYFLQVSAEGRRSVYPLQKQ